MRASTVLRKGAWLLWQLVRLPAFTLLTILEPAVRIVLGVLALLGVLTALVLKLAAAPRFPFLPMLGASIGCGLLLAGYHALQRVLSH
jgi:hypothetical protein